MPIFTAVLFGLVGALYIVFAFVPPPERISSLFQVPSILAFLPDRLVVPVGRVLIGVLLLVGVIVLWIKTH